MTLETMGYRPWQRQLRPSWIACWSIARTGLTLVLRRRIFWLLWGLALIAFLFFFAMIYLKATLVAANPGFQQFVDRLLTSVTGTGETYRDFMFAQGTATMLLLAFAGETLVGADYRRGGLTFYLSRRIGRWEYLVGKLLTIAMLVSLTTTLPALILYVEYGVLSESLSYFRENYRILLGILGYGAAMAIVLSLVLFALASWLRNTVPLVVAWACLFVFLPAIGELLRRVYDERAWRLLSLWRNIRLVGNWCFGAVREQDEVLGFWAAVVVALVCVVCLATSIPRLQPTQVVQ